MSVGIYEKSFIQLWQRYYSASKESESDTDSEIEMEPILKSKALKSMAIHQRIYSVDDQMFYCFTNNSAYDFISRALESI